VVENALDCSTLEHTTGVIVKAPDHHAHLFPTQRRLWLPALEPKISPFTEKGFLFQNVRDHPKLRGSME